jgi:hypothetical protein
MNLPYRGSPTGIHHLPQHRVALTGLSCRRKYRKIMVVFEEKMRESNSLFKEEQRILDISQRLAEQTE